MVLKRSHRLYFSALACAFVALACFVSSHAEAQTTRFYTAGYLGLNIPTEMEYDETATFVSGDYDLENGTVFAGALGFRFSKKFRIEGELSYRKTDNSSMTVSNTSTVAEIGGDLAATMAMLNFYYDFDSYWKNVQPFIGAGLGYGTFDLSLSNAPVNGANRSDANAIVFAAGGGLKYRPRSDFAFVGSYRYLDTLNTLDFNGFEVDYGAHELLVGIEVDLK